MAGNASLGAARVAKNDEFYTQWNDIECEMRAYLEYDPDVFRGKVVLLPCDDPEASNFTKYFALNFNKLGLKKLISTSYAPCRKGRIYVTEQGANLSEECLKWDYLESDGDFHSEEVTKLRDEADMVITNPPFSLFREFLAWLVEGDVKFSIIGNKNAITYKEVFPLIKENRLWVGATGNTTDMVFRVPQGAVVKESDKAKAARLGYPSTEATTYTRLGNSCWFTNIKHGRRYEKLKLMTVEENLRSCKYKAVRENGYQKYDNYDAIEVPYTVAIPSDHGGEMGVPISFLDKYSPEQFEILGLANSARHLGPISWRTIIDGRKIYNRILIRHREKAGTKYVEVGG